MSNPNLSEQEEIRVGIEEAERAIGIYHALNRLKADPDYQLIIETMYMKEQALDQVSLLAHKGMKEDRDEIIEDLVSKSNLQMFLLIIEKQGERFENDLREYHEAQNAELEEVQEA